MGVASKLAVATADEPATRSVQCTDLPFWCWAADGGDGRPRRVLTSFAGSELARRELRTAGGDPTTWLARLRELVPDLAFVGEPLMKVWESDELARGSYSVLDNRSWDHVDLFERTVGRVAFAGEHTAGIHHYATMEGALRSGRRAAEQVLAMLRG